MKRISAVLLVASVAACAPVVTHGPRVEPGTSLVVTAGASYSPCDTETCELALLPQASLGLRTGRPAGQTAPGLSAGGSLSLNLLSSDVDLYAQAPTGLTGALEAGGGVLLSLAHTMPYVQLGRTAADGSGWYTTQGFVWMSRRQADYTLTGGLDEEEPDEMRPRYWAPSIAYRTRGASGLQVYAAGAFGTADVYAFDDAQKVGRQPVRFLMAGVIVQGSPELLLPWRF